jgi:hypothetical protein
VRQGDQRLCLLRVDSPQLLRESLRAPAIPGSGPDIRTARFAEPGKAPQNAAQNNDRRRR